jgi:hypothetical protein
VAFSLVRTRLKSGTVQVWLPVHVNT